MDRSPMVESVSVDVRRHAVLVGEAHELDVMSPPQHSLEQVTHPGNDPAFASAWFTVDKVEEWLVWRGGDATRAFFFPFRLYARRYVPQEGKLLRVRLVLLGAALFMKIGTCALRSGQAGSTHVRDESVCMRYLQDFIRANAYAPDHECGVRAHAPLVCRLPRYTLGMY